MLDLIVDPDRCTQCGQCVADCPVGVLEADGGPPRVLPHRENACIGCQHCLAVCPAAALSVFGLNPDHSPEVRPVSPEMVENLMRGRRSVRRYKKEAVPREIVDRLMSVVMYAPSGKNRRQVSFTLVDDPHVMDVVRSRTYEAIRQAARENRLPEKMGFFVRFADAWAKGRDPIFQHAPQMVIASEPAENPSAEANPFIALTYFELMAASLGLGTLWCGFARWALCDVAPEMLRLLNIPEDHRSLYVMLFGYPAVRYTRTVQRGISGVRRVVLEK